VKSELSPSSCPLLLVTAIYLQDELKLHVGKMSPKRSGVKGTVQRLGRLDQRNRKIKKTKQKNTELNNSY